MSKLNLISSLEDNPKQKFQLFEVEIGFERAEVLIPFENSEVFETEALSKSPRSLKALEKLTSKFGGTFR